MRKILLVEDDESLGFIIKDNLVHAGYSVDLMKDGQQGMVAFEKNTYDICILDVMLPQKDGFSLAAEIKKKNQIIPIIFLTAKSQIEDKVQGFKIGADDYISKPFEMRELLLRVDAILKRIETLGKDTDRGKFTVGRYNFDYNNFELIYENNRKTLTKKEAELLYLLVKNKGKVVERALLLKSVWGENDYFLGRSMDVFITRLRKYLNKDSSIKISNVHGVGFRLDIESL
jgi:DNA-binding response OmpR family regulator